MISLRILLVKLSAIGDVVHCLPLAARIKEFLPDCKLTWLVEPAARDLVSGNPAVDEVLVFPRKTWLKDLKSPLKAFSTPPSVLSFFADLRRRKFDLAIDAQGLLKSAVPAYLSGAPRRLGFAGTREGASLLLTDPLLVKEEGRPWDYFAADRHVVDLNLALADHVLKIAGGISGADSSKAKVSFPLPDPGEARRSRIALLLEGSGVTPGSSRQEAPVSKMAAENYLAGDSDSEERGAGRKIVALIPSTTWATKIWPGASWIELGAKLAKHFGVRLVLLGGPADRPLNQSIYKGIVESESGAEIIDLTGETGLMDLVAVFERCDLVLGADTGPLHLAAAVAQNNGSPRVVAVHGSTPWLRNGPYGYMGSTIHLQLACQPCFEKKCPLGTLACLKDLPVGEVFQELSKLLE